MTALSKCGDFSCDQSVISFCQNVWKIKSVEVPNPATNPVQRIRSHNYLHLQDSGSLAGGEDSYTPSMQKLDENRVDEGSHDSKSTERFH